ncbi:hypothetical protein ALC56_04183 [Trachymyrmex septentrionalis]|uniref:Uncharacterized protein n=1 Tax=Trachymyrmex septentrionalis TaxID=34720 RepID=A0A151JYG5_9HYME|nr:hypothetical protein ALC56_04183 [Trachymyrmex septentrionalis]
MGGTRGRIGSRRRSPDSPEHHQQPIFTFKDVEDAFETFSGDNSESVKFENFEEMRLYEFSRTLNSKHVHQKLMRSKMKQNEDIVIIDSIPNNETSKSILYGASTIKELRQRLQNTERQRQTKDDEESPELEKISVPFDGIGSTNNPILGRFKTNVTIDGLCIHT